jgi:hypothetical protein
MLDFQNLLLPPFVPDVFDHRPARVCSLRQIRVDLLALHARVEPRELEVRVLL